jgi:HSP20 family protein
MLGSIEASPAQLHDRGTQKPRKWRSQYATITKKGGIVMKSLIRLDPFRVMRRWDPFSELRDMQHDMDRLFDRFLGRDISVSEAGYGEWMPSVESYTKGNDLVFKCELPGVDPKEVDVTVDENARQLIIKGERKTEKGAKDEDYLYRELVYGSFERRLALPEGIKTEQVKAKFTNGILEITVPAPAISKPKRIEIETPKLVEGEAAVKKAA